jgi:hypothetical protein
LAVDIEAISGLAWERQRLQPEAARQPGSGQGLDY